MWIGVVPARSGRPFKYSGTISRHLFRRLLDFVMGMASFRPSPFPLNLCHGDISTTAVWRCQLKSPGFSLAVLPHASSAGAYLDPRPAYSGPRPAGPTTIMH